MKILIFLIIQSKKKKYIQEDSIKTIEKIIKAFIHIKTNKKPKSTNINNAIVKKNQIYLLFIVDKKLQLKIFIRRL